MVPTSMLITELIASLFSEHDHVFGLCERKNVVRNNEKLKKNEKKPWNCKAVNLTNSKNSFLSERRHTFIPKWQHQLSWTSILYAICRVVWRPEKLEGKRSNRKSDNGKGFTSISFKVCHCTGLFYCTFAVSIVWYFESVKERRRSCFYEFWKGFLDAGFVKPSDEQI